MRPPRLESVYFETSGSGRWTRLARVLRTTAEAHCPDWALSIDRLAPAIDPRSPILRSWQANTHKLAEWARRVRAAEDGDRMLLADSDAMILRPLDDVWAESFDLAYTVKRGRFPFNAGVVFLRVSDRTRAFMSDWVAANARVLADERPAEFWIRQYGGVNQASLAELLMNTGLQLAQLPCHEWNCEDTNWRRFDPAVTRIVHLKGALRTACFSPPDESVETAHLARLWRQVETSQASARRSA